MLHNALKKKVLEIDDQDSNIFNPETRNKQIYKVAELDYTKANSNATIGYGILTCIYTGYKGWFCPKLQKYPSRQDLAFITNIRLIEL